MNAAYFKAAVPEPYRIFGVRLLPLSLGRYRLLKRFDCAFVAEGEAMATMEDLILGILICSMPCTEFIEFIESHRSGRQIARWGKRIRKQIREEELFSLIEKFGLFKAYIAEGSAVPQYWDEEESRSPSGAHWAQNLEVVLRSELGYSSHEIEEGPLSKALADYFKYAESQRLIRLMTEEEVKQGELNAALFAELMKGGQCPDSN